MNCDLPQYDMSSIVQIDFQYVNNVVTVHCVTEDIVRCRIGVECHGAPYSPLDLACSPSVSSCSAMYCECVCVWSWNLP
jgi:hypothetical protein